MAPRGTEAQSAMPAELRAYFAEIGRKGGEVSRSKNTTAQRRQWGNKGNEIKRALKEERDRKAAAEAERQAAIAEEKRLAKNARERARKARRKAERVSKAAEPDGGTP